MTYRAAVYMRLDSSSQVERSDVEQAAKDWATRPYGNGNQIGPERIIKRFRLIVCGWLRFAGRLQEPNRAPGPHQGEVDAYCRYMDGPSGAKFRVARDSGAIQKASVKGPCEHKFTGNY